MSLFTTSTDQTTRVFSEYYQPGNWYEMGRPQIHGYDMNTLTTARNQMEGDQLSSKILSGGDEKVLRLFEAPYNYIKTINTLNPSILQEKAVKLRFSMDLTNEEVESRLQSETKKQALGLMNKQAVFNPKVLAEPAAEVAPEESKIETKEEALH